ncbi:follistatin-related 4 [Labeo rohita]|uniref:Follistatin-related 4 n=1 Tax=Labeo rohita TaxID=84645 RepID=A0A498N9M9_LABRO|nr:follistatin-related 4 [Labeo rohita]RXN36366.1 follistatin-related 4 [Labeo rohita]
MRVSGADDGADLIIFTVVSNPWLMLMGWLGVWALSVLLGSSPWLAYGVRASAGTESTVKEVEEGLQQYGGAENKVKQICLKISGPTVSGTVHETANGKPKDTLGISGITG